MSKYFYIDSNYSRHFKTSDRAKSVYYGHFIVGHLIKTFAFLHDNNLLEDILNNDVILYMNRVNEVNMGYYRELIGNNVYRLDDCPHGVDRVFLTENNDNGFCFSESELSGYPPNDVIWTNNKHYRYLPFLREFVVKKYGYRKPINLIYAARKNEPIINGERKGKFCRSRHTEFDNENNVVDFLKELAEKNNLIFKNIYFPDISVKDRIISSLESKIVFGLNGAQLFNLMFQPEKSLFIEFFIKNTHMFRKCCRTYKNICKKGDNLPQCCYLSLIAKTLNYKYLRINALDRNGIREYVLFKNDHKIIIDRFVKENLDLSTTHD